MAARWCRTSLYQVDRLTLGDRPLQIEIEQIRDGRRFLLSIRAFGLRFVVDLLLAIE